MATVARELSENYKKYVSNNPETTSQIESLVRILSYLIPGSSPVVSELLYSASNLLVLLNDAVLRQVHGIKLKVTLPNKQLCTWLTVLEYVEVFLEIAGHHLGGEYWHWIIVVCVQLAKTVLRYILLTQHKSGVLSNPPIPPLKRNKELKDTSGTTLGTMPVSPSEDNLLELEKEESPHTTYNGAVNFTLKNSGRVVRSLAATPSLEQRSWTVPQSPAHEHQDYKTTRLDSNQMIAEYLHIFRPLVHLAGMYRYGMKSWKPWILASGMDVTSLYMHNPEQYNPVERHEIRRRGTLILLYLLRSPFYDNFTKHRLILLLSFLSKNVPVIRLICNPLLDYLPYWQRVYFYVWMN